MLKIDQKWPFYVSFIRSLSIQNLDVFFKAIVSLIIQNVMHNFELLLEAFEAFLTFFELSII